MEFYRSELYCSHDVAETFHHRTWRCWWREVVLRALEPPAHDTWVSDIDLENGTITFSSKPRGA